MLYALLSYEDQRPWQASEDEAARRLHAHLDFVRAMRRDGMLRGSARLKPFTVATSVRVHGRGTDLIDGPFADTGEQLVGYVLIEAGDLDEAIAAARRVPEAQGGTVEVRPVLAE
jgi:hypothetical protein